VKRNYIKEIISNFRYVEFVVSKELLLKSFIATTKEETGLDAEFNLDFDDEGDLRIIYTEKYLDLLNDEDYEKLVQAGYNPEEWYNTKRQLLRSLFICKSEDYVWANDSECEIGDVTIHIPFNVFQRVVNEIA